ncbi:MAG: phosphotransferase [Magnetococcus sp. DMHC-6]
MKDQPPSLLKPEAWRFLLEILGTDITVARASEDASFRSYYRVRIHGGNSFILMDAPPTHEDVRPFVDIGRFLFEHGVSVPKILAQNVETGHLLLEDFGDQTFLKALAAGVEAEGLYRRAVETLVTLQATPWDHTCLAHSRPYDRELLHRELALFTDWYVEGILKRPISPSDRQQFEMVFAVLMENILAQPVCLVHRDYHSRNLMWCAGERVGVLDFQDAVMGPVTYDLASLLRDCYVAWEAPFRKRVQRYWLEHAQDPWHYGQDWSRFEKDFDWMALQRNLKAVGIFGRLSLRDGKHGYLADIPRTLGYVWEVLPRYPQLEPLHDLLQRYIARVEA